MAERFAWRFFFKTITAITVTDNVSVSTHSIATPPTPIYMALSVFEPLESILVSILVVELGEVEGKGEGYLVVEQGKAENSGEAGVYVVDTLKMIELLSVVYLVDTSKMIGLLSVVYLVDTLKSILVVELGEVEGKGGG